MTEFELNVLREFICELYELAALWDELAALSDAKGARILYDATEKMLTVDPVLNRTAYLAKYGMN
jgi:hypothetical protein